MWRRVELPLTNSLKAVHLAIQAAVLFENYHLFQFDVGDSSRVSRPRGQRRARGKPSRR
ncbi:IS1096 element passenger TnpR family protein [Sphingobium sp. Ant17]|uniref:IS1096 element passenger TnpR family protein n=1 Tax=Sphingobium sp. Ant17 TaxID=1461752 RepID=UPI003FA76F1C